MLGVLKKIENLLFWVEQVVLVVFLFLLVGLSFFMAMLSVFRGLGWQWVVGMASSLSWGEIFLRHVVLIIAFIGASLATREGRHLSIDVVSRLLPRRVRAFWKAVLDLVSTTVCMILAVVAWEVTLDEISVAKALFWVGDLPVPRWLFMAVIPVGFFLIGLRFVIRGAQDFWQGWTGEVEEETPPL